MTDAVDCEYCGLAFPISMGRCPHCARPGLFPNVTMAELEDERKELERRYHTALRDADQRGCEPTVRAFEEQTSRSQAVIARSVEDTLKLAAGDNMLYPTYHQLTESELRIPEGSKWDRLRTLTDETLFGPYKKEVRFAALSLDGLGLMHYGDCSWVLRDEMIAHRASVFEENSVMFMERQGFGSDPEPGHRASWQERSRLCVAKLAGRIDSDTTPESFPEVLISQGSKPEEDDFVEVHIGGPMTVRTLERVILKKGALRNAMGKAVRAKLDRFGIRVESKSWKH